MKNNKVFKKYPLMNTDNLQKIPGWKPWKPKKQSINQLDLAYENYLIMEEMLISEQEKEMQEGSNKIKQGDDWFRLNKTRQHLAEASKGFANEMDFMKWVNDVINKSNYK